MGVCSENGDDPLSLKNIDVFFPFAKARPVFGTSGMDPLSQNGASCRFGGAQAGGGWSRPRRLMSEGGR